MNANAESVTGSPGAIHPDPGAPPDLETQVLDRLRQVLRERGATRDLLQMPQAILPLEASEVEALEYFPWKRMMGSKEALPLENLLQAPADAFVSRCYRLLLGRYPTAAETERSTTRVSGRLRRFLFVSSLRWGNEGRRFNVPLTGIVPLAPAISAVARSVVKRLPRYT